MAKVSFQNISFKYGDHQILKDFSLDIESGEILCLVGPSGCGKTTLVRCLLGLNKPETGEIYVGDTCIFSATRKINKPVERRNIGIVFQDYAVWPHLTVSENVGYPLKKMRVKKDEIARRVAETLEMVNMTEYTNHLPSQLSGGQQQRVAIARALVTNSDIIVMDEPITNLDAKLREQMLEEIREIQRKSGTTVLYITHDQQSALQLCDRMAIMEPNGNLCQMGTDEDIILHPANRFTFEFIGVSNFVPVEVSGGKLTLKPGNASFSWDDGVLPEGTDTSAGLEVGVRPNDIVFDPASPLKATVTRSVFLGSEYDYFIQMGGQELRVQQNALDAAKYGILKEGTETGVRFLNYRFYAPKKEVSA
ncbi:MAG: ABC transporter ATP-binding protein [Oscillospiraceae bacterium]|nr:ABC transporter ATP-binding protein [Oscillospiraceae bacterium]